MRTCRRGALAASAQGHEPCTWFVQIAVDALQWPLRNRNRGSTLRTVCKMTPDREEEPSPGAPQWFTVWLRFLFALGLGTIAAALLPRSAHVYLRILFAWDVGIALFVVLLWPFLRLANPRVDIPQGRGVSLRMVAALVVGELASILATGFMVADLHSLAQAQQPIAMALALLAVVGTWLLNNLVFGFRYAYVYYRHGSAPLDTPDIDFPGAPTGYWDFLYLAFEVGMTFGVTDTTLRSTRMRRLVLTHGVLSFWFNAAILALALNLVGSVL